MVRYVTLAYGDAPGVYRQSVMLLLSLVAHAPDPYEIVVATDRPECYVWFGTRIDIEYLGSATLKDWRGPDPFSMRQKLALIRAVWPRTGAAALLDADVVAHANLQPFVDRLLHGDLFMHKHEYELGRSRRAGNRRLWSSVRRRRFDAWEFRADDGMWNSGVLAGRVEDRPLFDRALELYDAMGNAGIRHFATEQLVEGAVLGRTGRLRAADEWFTHYWGNRPGYDAEIARRLAEAFLEGLSVKDAAARYREAPIALPIEVRSTRREKLQRWLSRAR